MAVLKTESRPLQSEQDIVMARQTVRRLALEIKLTLVDQTKIVTAASELARNALTYGGGGEMISEILLEGMRQGLRLTFVDHGPGIPNLELALTDGWTSGGGMGMGLSGARRLVNEFEIDTKVGQGTKVVITRWK